MYLHFFIFYMHFLLRKRKCNKWNNKNEINIDKNHFGDIIIISKTEKVNILYKTPVLRLKFYNTLDGGGWLGHSGSFWRLLGNRHVFNRRNFHLLFYSLGFDAFDRNHIYAISAFILGAEYNDLAPNTLFRSGWTWTGHGRITSFFRVTCCINCSYYADIKEWKAWSFCIWLTCI